VLLFDDACEGEAKYFDVTALSRGLGVTGVAAGEVRDEALGLLPVLSTSLL